MNWVDRYSTSVYNNALLDEARDEVEKKNMEVIFGISC